MCVCSIGALGLSVQTVHDPGLEVHSRPGMMTVQYEDDDQDKDRADAMPKAETEQPKEGGGKIEDDQQGSTLPTTAANDADEAVEDARLEDDD